MKKVFISYVRQDSRFVDRLVNVLVRNNIDVWLDRNDLDPGQHWEFAIRQAIRSGWKFLSIHSAKRLAREKTEANKELLIAFEEFMKRPLDSKWLIPIRIDDSDIPDRPIGGGVHYLQLNICDFRNFKKGATRLLAEFGVDEPTGLDEPEIKKGTDFQQPNGTWHAALEALEKWKKLFGVEAISRQQVSEFCPSRTLTDLSTLGLAQKVSRDLWRLAHEMEDVRLELSVAIARVPAFSLAAEMLRKDFRTRGTDIGAEISELIGADWKLASMQRNGGAYKRWTLALYPNFGGPKPGEPDYHAFEAMRSKRMGHGRNTVLTDDILQDVARWKAEGLNLGEMSRRLGLQPNILYNFRRNYPDRWDEL